MTQSSAIDESIKRAMQLTHRSSRPGSGLYYDPLYGYIPTSHHIRTLIDLLPFQRLRGIKQLSTLYLVFPGANHTRFEHSIGACHLARIAHDRLKSQQDQLSSTQGRPTLNKATQLAAEIGALLHDIGHGPFGHVFEMFCRRHPSSKHWNHESQGRRIITGIDHNFIKIEDPFFQQIPQFLESLKKSISSDIDDETSLSLLDPINIAAIAFGDPLPDNALDTKYHFMTQLVPSVFGVDRLDYLRRDAHYSGTSTGNIDIWNIIHGLRIDRARGDDRFCLYLPPSSLSAIENLLMTRDFVYRIMYHDPIHRSAQELLIRAILSLALNADTICLDSDSDLLARLAMKNSILSQEAESRLRFRLLYEAIPIASHQELGDRPIIDGYTNTQTDWADIQEKEKRILVKLGLTAAQTIMYDLETVPAIKQDDLTERIFIDVIGGNIPKSIIDISTRLRHLYSKEGTSILKSTLAYNLSSSMIYAYYPIDNVLRALTKCVRLQRNGDITTRINRIYSNHIEPLISGFFEMIMDGRVDINTARIIQERVRKHSTELLKSMLVDLKNEQ